MSNVEIVEHLAKRKVVEHLVENITRRAATSANMQDLIQIIYLALLEYDSEKIEDLWERGQIKFFIVRIIINQYRTDHSPFADSIRKFARRSKDLKGFDCIDKTTIDE